MFGFMKEISRETKIGRISLDLLFKGSKSEAIYPVLHCEDGESYRLHVKGNEAADAPLFEHLNGLKVQVSGEADNLRGHWRMLLENLDESVQAEVNEEDPSDPAEESTKDVAPLDPVPKDSQ